MLFLITSLFSLNVNAFPEPVMSTTCCFVSVVAVNEAVCDSLVKELMEQFLFITKVDYAGEMGKWSWGMNSSVEAAMVAPPVASVVTWKDAFSLEMRAN